MVDDQPASRNGTRRAARFPGVEARGAERVTLLLRVAKLIAGGREYLCVLRDVSASGARLRLFCPLPEAPLYALGMSNGDVHPMQLVWINADHAGFRFDDSVDLPRLLDDRDGELRRRPVRLKLDLPVIVHAGAGAQLARLRNISLTGAGLVCTRPLRLHQPVRIERAGAPEIGGQVCRCQHPDYGVVFDCALDLGEGARRLARLYDDSAGPHQDLLHPLAG